MGRLAPEVILEQNPIAFDEVITYYQLLFGNLNWPGHISLGRAYEQVEDGREVPKVYDGKREYYNALPNDRLNSYSFLMARTPETYTDTTTLERDVSAIFWVDLKKVRPGFDTPTVEPLRLQVLQMIKDSPYYVSINSYVDEKIEDVFMGYIEKDSENKYLMFPYSGFRIDFTVGYPEPCGEPLDQLITITTANTPVDYILLKLGGRVAKLKLALDGDSLTTELEELL